MTVSDIGQTSAPTPTAYPTVFVPDVVRTNKPTPTSYPTILVTNSLRTGGPTPTPHPTIRIEEGVSVTLRPTPSIAPTPLNSIVQTDTTTAPTESVIFKSKYSSSGIQIVTYFAYTVGFIGVAGGLGVFFLR